MAFDQIRLICDKGPLHKNVRISQRLDYYLSIRPLFPFHL